MLVLGLCCGHSIVAALVGGFVACRLLSGELPVLMNLRLLCFCALIQRLGGYSSITQKGLVLLTQKGFVVTKAFNSSLDLSSYASD
ncbi:hypothetical protein MtrunA17_Chr7g0225101 [Medicago truncatula]|nr:hypothetical protein MtrunA17_Chr7g0225101 [Medicago truncatula]